jgi:hypothetical protein
MEISKKWDKTHCTASATHPTVVTCVRGRQLQNRGRGAIRFRRNVGCRSSERSSIHFSMTPLGTVAMLGLWM